MYAKEWYVLNGDDFIEGDFDTEDKALASARTHWEDGRLDAVVAKFVHESPCRKGERDGREAGSGGVRNSPTALPETGSASPSAYHRDLANKAYSACRSVEGTFIPARCAARIADVLADEGVVDPDQLLCHAEDLIADWQAGNIQTKDMTVRLHLFVETVTALRAAIREEAPSGSGRKA